MLEEKKSAIIAENPNIYAEKDTFLSENTTSAILEASQNLIEKETNDAKRDFFKTLRLAKRQTKQNGVQMGERAFLEFDQEVLDFAFLPVDNF